MLNLKRISVSENSNYSVCPVDTITRGEVTVRRVGSGYGQGPPLRKRSVRNGRYFGLRHGKVSLSGDVDIVGQYSDEPTRMGGQEGVLNPVWIFGERE